MYLDLDLSFYVIIDLSPKGKWEIGPREGKVTPVTSSEMALGFAPGSEFPCGEQLRQSCEKHQEDGHAHDDHIVADAGSNIKPAAMILDQEEKMQSHNVRYDKNHEEKTFWW